jgi:TetR/AcrR family transcriptional repressor of nem operon
VDIPFSLILCKKKFENLIFLKTLDFYNRPVYYIQIQMAKSEIKELILQEGAKIIHLKGFHNTGINEILESAGVPKGSFYFYFKNKEDFGLQLIDYLSPHFSSQAQKHLQSPETLYLKKMSSFFDKFQSYYEEQSCKMGCPIGNLALEMGDLNENFRKKLDEVMESMKRSVFEFLKGAQDNKEISSDFDIMEVSDFILNSWEGALLRMKIRGDISPLQNFKKTVFVSILSSSFDNKNA